ncbi:MAG: ABC transporter permease subunit [Clostridiales bacterium]|nr:ABC transporter permease subunit [Clostridiales bacterium]
MEKLSKKYKRYWQLYLFLLIPVAYVFIFNYIPMVGVQISFKKLKITNTIWNAPWVGLENFQRFLGSYQFFDILLNTVVLSVYSVLAAFPFPILFALTLNAIEKNRFKKTIQTITYIPHFISVVVLVSIVNQVLHPMTGIYGVLFKAITGRMPDDLMGIPSAFPHIYVWSSVWQNFGYNSIIYFAALSSVDPELHEAAKVDGASRFRRVLHVDVPAILPTITIMLILRMSTVMTIGFQKVYLMQNTLNLETSEVISTYVYKKGLASGVSNDYSYSTAVDLFNSIVNLLLVTVSNTISRKVSETSLW